MSEAPLPNGSARDSQQPAPGGAPAGQPVAGRAAAPATTAPEVSDRMARLAVEEAMARLRAQQNLAMGVAAGAAAAVGTAILWAVITAATKYQIGFMAIGVGFAVGIAVRFAGKGVDTSFRIAGAVLAILGCVLGNALAISYLVANHFNVSIWKVLGAPSILVKGVTADFGFMDAVFYAIAAYCGWQYSLRTIDEAELQKLGGGEPGKPESV